ncbi:MAG: hypothetical protein R3C70_06430 [Geminicoccaceae bacterium]
MRLPDERGPDRLPCPACGGKRRAFNETISVGAQLEMGILTQGKSGKKIGRRGPAYWWQEKKELYRKTGEWQVIVRDFNRENDRYREVIRDVKTGTIVKKIEEPLSEHIGHGSAKKSLGEPENGG